jgi:flagellar biosynthetic protein FliR
VEGQILMQTLEQAGGVFLRVGGFFVAMPLFSGPTVPARVRLLLALAVTWMILPVAPPSRMALLGPEGVLVAIEQILLGIAMGMVLQIVFQSVLMAGQMIATAMGLGFAVTVDPVNGVSEMVVGQYFQLVASLLFLALDGHLAVIRLVAESFQLLPVGLGNLPAASLETLLRWSAHLFSGAVQMALPALAALMMVNLILGVTTRAAPALNLFAVGFPISLSLGLLAVMWTLPVMVRLFEPWLEAALLTLRRLIGMEG